jgi:hypothetical protein
MYWSMANADPGFGHMWQQVLATSVSYGLFLLVIGVALVLRWRWLRVHAASASSIPAAAAAQGLLP